MAGIVFALINPFTSSFREEINLPIECSLDLLPKNCEKWETDCTNVPHGSIILGELHLRIMCFPLHPLIHYICTMCSLHHMQLAPNAIHQMIGFISRNTVTNLDLNFDDFWHIFCMTKSTGNYNVGCHRLSPRKPYSLFPCCHLLIRTGQEAFIYPLWQLASPCR